MLSHTSKLVLMFLGLLASSLIVAQLFVFKPLLPYLSTAVSLVYIFFSVWVMTSLPTTAPVPPPTPSPPA